MLSPGEDLLKRITMLLAAGAIALLGACSRTEDGDVVVKRPADVDVQTTQDTLHMPSMTTKIDTVNTPVVGTKNDPMIPVAWVKTFTGKEGKASRVTRRLSMESTLAAPDAKAIKKMLGPLGAGER